jgi:hypothetical protein
VLLLAAGLVFAMRHWRSRQLAQRIEVRVPRVR